ncbi:DUF4867 family protein [Companilactobacillus futsaii]|uniref:DUF4867 family protein n=2 Tax=Companilactobacillus futsaii TaxID=938155 RepID=A0A5B7SZW6_9LACO|nr:DUF4867 family protein [Companilactobacillus futsaii]KRK98365.1 hypothetical protein FC88_GL001381 [Companilactobacillus futsaii JCM 17355]QCX25346.1 DUF4867 family protein [Companilactobacillus futsaii]
MSTLADFQKKNPDYKILSIDDPDFKKYGKVYTKYDISEVKDYMDKNVKISSPSNFYTPSNKDLEKIPAIQEMGKDIYAFMPIEAGECTGQSTNFSAIEYHQGSETNIMLTDVIMVLGQRSTLDTKGEYSPSEDGQIFFVPAGTVVEFYSTTLHYAPIKVHDSGFSIIVILIKGSNEELPADFKSDNKRIVKQNKFQLVDPSRKDKIAIGVEVGLTGKLIEMTPLDK